MVLFIDSKRVCTYWYGERLRVWNSIVSPKKGSILDGSRTGYRGDDWKRLFFGRPRNDRFIGPEYRPRHRSYLTGGLPISTARYAWKNTQWHLVSFMPNWRWLSSGRYGWAKRLPIALGAKSPLWSVDFPFPGLASFVQSIVDYLSTINPLIEKPIYPFAVGITALVNSIMERSGEMGSFVRPISQ